VKVPKDRGGRPKLYDSEVEEIDPDAYGVQKNLVEGLSSQLKQLVKFGGDHSMTSRAKQKLASEAMVSLMMQPEYRIRFVDWALKNPGEAAKLMATQIPKEIHIEQTTQHNIVILPPSMTSQEWLDQNNQVEDAEVIPWLEEKIV
jgi:hypothetical protein